MILDVREWSELSFEEKLAARRRVFIDGVEIQGAWFVDTEMGFVRTYNVLGDARWHTVEELTTRGRMASDWDEVELEGRKVASKTLMGRIELRAYDERRA